MYACRLLVCESQCADATALYIIFIMPFCKQEGVAVVMTSTDQKTKLEGAALGQDLVESHLMPRLLEALNCEVHQVRNSIIITMINTSDCFLHAT
jgi:hypothetical protein